MVTVGLIAWWYFPAAFRVAASDTPSELFGLSIGCIVALIVLEIVYHAMIANGGSNSADERDRFITLKAERVSGWVLAIGLFWLVGHIVAGVLQPALTTPNALSIAVWILFAPTVSEFAKLLSQVVYYRADA